MPLRVLLLGLFGCVLSSGTQAHALWAEGDCDGGKQGGATHEYFNRAANLTWRHDMGDWVDSAGVSQGAAPIATVDIPDIDKEQVLRLDVTGVVAEWLSGELPNKGFMLRTLSGGSARLFSREHQAGSRAAKLVLSFGDGIREIPVSADTWLTDSTYKCQGHKTSLNTGGSVLLYFGLDDVNAPRKLQKAELVLNTSNRQYGASALGVFLADPSYRNYTLSDSGDGLAAEYLADDGLLDDPRVLLAARFEDADWGKQWSTGSDSSTLSQVEINTEERFSSLYGKALQATLPEGKLTAMNLNYLFDKELGSEPEEIYLRYYLRLGDSWQTVDGGKLPGIAGTYDGSRLRGGWGGRTSNGNNGWSARGSFRTVVTGNNPLQGRVAVGSYLYHADMTERYGDVLVWDGTGLSALEKNRWYAIEQHVRINTPGKNDGLFRAWIDGVPAYEIKGLKLRNADRPEIRIDRIWMNIYHGGTTPNDRTVTAFIDNVVVATEYIGPISKEQHDMATSRLLRDKAASYLVMALPANLVEQARTQPISFLAASHDSGEPFVFYKKSGDQDK